MYFQIYVYIYFVRLNWSGYFNHRSGSFALSVIANAPSSFAYFPAPSSLPSLSLVVHFRNTNRQEGIAKGRVITARFLQYGLSTNGHLIFAPPTTTYYLSVLCLRRLSSGSSSGSNTLSWHPSGWLAPPFLSFMMK